MVLYAGTVLSPSRNLRNAAVGRVLPKMGISVCDLFSAIFCILCIIIYLVRFLNQLKTV